MEEFLISEYDHFDVLIPSALRDWVQLEMILCHIF